MAATAESQRDASVARALAADVCERVTADADLEALWPEARSGLRRLNEALRVAVTGRGSAGKSTLVNALIGRRIAATGEGETTAVNCEFRSAGSEPEKAEVRLAGCDAALEIPVDEVAGLAGLDKDVAIPVVVHLHHPLLEALTVIDSPGLGSPNEELSDRAKRVTGAAIRDTDAALFATSELPDREEDYDEVDRFRTLFGDTRRAPTNSLIVFNQADRIEGAAAPDPVASARRRLEREDRSYELRQRVAAATATVGILAEAARTEFVDDRLVADLRALGEHVRDRRDLVDGQILAALELPVVPAERRRELTARLGGFGVAAATELVHAGADRGRLSQRLLELSGLAALEQMLERAFAARSGLLRADATLGALSRRATELRVSGALSRRAHDRVDAWVHDALRAPSAHPLRQLHALWLTFEPRIGLDEEALDEVRDLLNGGTGRPGEDGELEPVAWASERAAVWRRFASRLPETSQREVAEVTSLTYERLARRDWSTP